jgi:hypothetical protein
MPTAADLRTGLVGLSRLASADLTTLWATVATAEQARDALVGVLPPLADSYATAAAALAADWYDEVRATDNIDGRFFAITAKLDNLGADVLARWGVAPLFRAEPDWADAQTLIDGGLQRRIANAARDTVTLSSIRDPQATGWQRVAQGGCAFCRMLAARGAVYSRETVDFASHDHCHCVAVPAFRGRPLPVKPYHVSRRTVSDIDRARVRQYLAEHPAG